MEWREQKPASVGPLDAILPRLRTPATRAYAQGYLALRAKAGGALPSRSGFDLAPFVPAVPHFALLAVTLAGGCVYRLAGDTLQQRLGFDPKGRDYYDFVPAARLSHARRAMEMMVRRPCGFLALVEQTYEDGATCTIETLGLPLADKEPDVDGFILFADCALPEPPTYHAPGKRWLGANIVRRDLIDLGFGIDADFVDLVRAG
ncbi:MAG: PAS domain-containing protein [Tagaea sp.]|nr:PAS domain-containing protein [Tagaea sp.]